MRNIFYKVARFLVILAMLLIFCFVSLRLIQNESNIIYKIFISLLLYSVLYVFISIALSKVKNPIVIRILGILGIPVVLLVQLHFYVAPLVTIIMFFAFYLLPTSLSILWIDRAVYLKPYKDGIIYLVNVFAILFYAYQGNKIISFIKLTTKPIFASRVIDKYTTVEYTRVFTYGLMILIYLTYNFITFSGVDNLKLIPDEQLAVIKEVMVTFVAIDTLIQIIKNGKKKVISH